MNINQHRYSGSTLCSPETENGSQALSQRVNSETGKIETHYSVLSMNLIRMDTEWINWQKTYKKYVHFRYVVPQGRISTQITEAFCFPGITFLCFFVVNWEKCRLVAWVLWYECLQSVLDCHLQVTIKIMKATHFLAHSDPYAKTFWLFSVDQQASLED